MNETLGRILHHRQHILTTADLRAAGCTRRDIASGVASGELHHIRVGHYAGPRADPEVVRAVRVGGVLAGPSAARHWKIWTPHVFRLTVSIAHNEPRLRDPDDPRQPLRPGSVVIHRDRHHLDPAAERLVASPTTVVVQAILHLPRTDAIGALDSALRLPGPDRPRLADLEARLPRSKRALLKLADPAAGSGTESIFRLGLIDAQIPFRSQVWLTAHIRVDFLVDGWLVVECGSREWHGDEGSYNRNRARDAIIVTLGYVGIEFSYPQVMFEWEAVWAAFLRSLAGRPSAVPRPAG